MPDDDCAEPGCGCCHREEDEAKRLAQRMRDRVLIALGLCLTIPLAAVELLWEGAPGFIMLALATPVQFVVGWRFYKGTYDSIRGRRLDMSVLVAASTSVAYFYSAYATSFGGTTFFEASTVVVTLVSLGEHLEDLARDKVSYAVEKLVQMQPKTALVVRDGVEEDVLISEIKLGDLVLVKAGERVPVDGMVMEGCSAVDESIITGESMPVDKAPGDDVIGGTMNANGVLRVRASKIGEHAALAQIIKLVTDAQESRAPIQRVADRMVAVFIPLVIGVAIGASLLWLFAGNMGLPFSLTVLITVLIIACPCALGVSVPTVIMVGTSKGAEHGILYKRGSALERSASTTVVVLDKTGTVTKGRLSVVGVVPLNGSDEAEIVHLASVAECSSDHPIAKAIVQANSVNHTHEHACTSFRAVPGYGMEGISEGRKLLIGNRRLLELNDIHLHGAAAAKYDELESKGNTVVILAVDGKPKGLLALADTVKDTSRAAVASLRAMGIRVVMVTGDNERVAKAIATEAGIEEVHHGVTPEKKAWLVGQFKADGSVVMMVGDGINDAPALASADVGVAMGSGTDVAIEAGDIVVVRGDLRDIAKLLGISKASMRKIRQNLAFSFLYNFIGISVAAGALYPAMGMLVLTPMIAAGGEVMSDLVVVGNALQLKSYNPK